MTLTGHQPYSKTCVKQPLKSRQNKDLKFLMTNESLMKAECIAECSPWSLESKFLVFLRVVVLHRFYCIYSNTSP